MGFVSHWPIILGVLALLVVFGGGGKLSGFMGDAAKGIKAFRDGLRDENTPAKPETPAVIAAPETAAQPATQREDVKS